MFEAARLLRDDPDIHFLLSGWEIGFEQLNLMQSKEKLRNLTLIDRVQDNDLEEFLSAANVWLIPYRKNIAEFRSQPVLQSACGWPARHSRF